VYERLLTADRQVFDLYRDAAATSEQVVGDILLRARQAQLALPPQRKVAC
jgi:hypothetical protein